MRRMLALMALMAAALFIGTAVAPAGKTPISPQDSCAAVLGVEDASACGGQNWMWYYMDSSPPGGQWVGYYINYCSTPWAITYFANSFYRYTAQCRPYG